MTQDLMVTGRKFSIGGDEKLFKDTHPLNLLENTNCQRKLRGKLFSRPYYLIKFKPIFTKKHSRLTIYSTDPGT